MRARDSPPLRAARPWWRPTAGRELAGLLLLGTLLTAVMAAPVLRAPSHRLFGTEIAGRHPDAYTSIRSFEQGGPRLPYLQPATDWPGVLLARRIGGVAAYNLVVLASFPLAAVFTFLLARRLGSGRTGATAAALAYAFSPFHVAHSAYHPHVAQVQWLPLYLLALWLCLERWTPARTLLLLLAAALVALSSYYAGFFTAVLTPVAIVAHHAATRGRGARAGPALRRTAVTLLAALTLAAVGFLLLVPEVSRLPHRFAFPGEDLQRYGARWWSYLVPPVGHPLLDGVARAVWSRHPVGDGLVEQQVGLSLALVALALAAWRVPSRDRPPALPFLACLAAAAFACSLRPPATAGWMERIWPSALLHELAPMFRAYARFAQHVHLAVYLAAALGITRLLERGGGRRRRGVAVLLVVAAVELAPFPPWRWHHVLPTAAHRYLAELPGPLRILDCGPGRLAGERTVVALMPHPTALVGGDLPDCGEPGLAGKLAALGYTHVVVRGDSPVARHLDPPPLIEGLRPERHFDDSRVLAVAAPESPVFTRRLEGFYWREYSPRGTYRWMGPAGTWTVSNRTSEPLAAVLEIELAAFPHRRTLTVATARGAVATLEVDVEPRVYELGPVTLRPGPTRLLLRPQGPATVPDEVLGNGDRRPLTVSVWQWRWHPAPAAANGRPPG